MKLKRIFAMFAAVAMAAALTLTPALAQDKASDDVVKIAYVEWADAVAATNVVKALIEDKLGKDVKLYNVSAAAMWKAVASGDVDAMVAAWLPTTHAHYIAAVKDQVDDLGPNLDGTRIGLVVPKYVKIDSIDQLNANAAEFEGQIIGIDPGAGLMSKTEKVLKDYNLDKMKLVEGSDATMTAALGNAIKANKPIVVTGWTPHWMFARWDLKYLDDPKGVYGGAEHINTVTRKGFKKDMPEVYALLDAFYWTPKDVATIMVWNQEPGADPLKTAQRWIKENPDKVKAWLGK